MGAAVARDLTRSGLNRPDAGVKAMRIFMKTRLLFMGPRDWSLNIFWEEQTEPRMAVLRVPRLETNPDAHNASALHQLFNARPAEVRAGDAVAIDRNQGRVAALSRPARQIAPVRFRYLDLAGGRPADDPLVDRNWNLNLVLRERTFL
jgi:hypothetical protein